VKESELGPFCSDIVDDIAHQLGAILMDAPAVLPGTTPCVAMLLTESRPVISNAQSGYA
jgi:hypothetical protein